MHDLTINGLPVPKDIFAKILSLVYPRQSEPKRWDSLKLVSKAFKFIIHYIEANDKLIFCNNVHYSEEGTLDEIRTPTEYLFLLRTTDKIIAFKQLGRQPIHFWAPILTCNELFQLNLYEIKRDSRETTSVCAYDQHKARLTAAISMDGCIVSADSNGWIGVWSPPTQQSSGASTIGFYRGHQNAVSAIDYVSGTVFVTGGDAEVKTWNIQSATPLNMLSVCGEVKDLRALSANKLLVLTLVDLHAVRLTLYQEGAPTRLYNCDFDVNIYPFLIADDMRIASLKRVAALINDTQTLGALDISSANRAESKELCNKQKPISTFYGFLSRGNFCTYATRNKNSYSVTLCKPVSESRNLTI